MNDLLVLSIGPVQDFIAAARRTADLAAGSKLLQSLVRVAAQTVMDAGGRLIVPEKPQDGGANKILAEVPPRSGKVITQGVKDAVQRYVIEEWERVSRRLEPSDVDFTLAGCQLANYIEVQSAWTSMGSDYSKARERVGQLLAGRKALRDFDQPHSDAGRVKSALDPTRDSVLNRSRGRTSGLVPDRLAGAPLWLKASESLDAMSLMKRLLGHTSHRDVPSTSMMTLMALISEMDAKAVGALAELRRRTQDLDSAVDLGDLFHRSDLLGDGPSDRELDRLCKDCLGAVGRTAPPTYYAILQADGDNIGRAIEGCKTVKAHQEFSRALARFEGSANAICKKNHGHLIYAGGDDVQALLPVQTALDCARELAEEFGKALDEGAGKTESDSPTLSVGLAIVHHLEPLDIALQHARHAEKDAKLDKASLTVALHTRGGGTVKMRTAWQANDRDPSGQPCFDDWGSASKLMKPRTGISRGYPYELRALAAEFGSFTFESELPPTGDPSVNPSVFVDAAHARSGWQDYLNRLCIEEANRIRLRKRMESSEPDHPLPAWVRCPKTLDDYATLLVIARFLTRAGDD